MHKMTIHITKTFETAEECKTEYDEIRGELVKHEDLHINCQIVNKLLGYNPTFPDGRIVEP